MQLIPVTKTSRKKRASTDPTVKDARKKVQSAFAIYQQDPSKKAHEMLQEAKTNLQNAYTQIEEEELRQRDF